MPLLDGIPGGPPVGEHLEHLRLRILLDASHFDARCGMVSQPGRSLSAVHDAASLCSRQ
ncbi:MAG: hypothetical protein ACR2IK_04925 [Chloroflexota bacterium]